MQDRARKILKTFYGYDCFRKGQEEVIENILNHNDCVAIMPTGSGKSLCYQIPAIAFEGITLVISPLISLMKDQVADLNQMGIRAAYLNSSLNERQQAKAIANAKKGMYKIIYVAPERLNLRSFLEFTKEVRIDFIAVDEAHCISQWGHDFRTSYLKIPQFLEKLNNRPVLAAFTATATQQVKEDIIQRLNLDNPFSITTGFDRKNLFFSVFKPIDKMAFVFRYLNKNKDKSGIIYCSTRKQVDEVTKALKVKGINAQRYHAGLSDEERNKNQDDFIFDNVKVIVATNAFGMGIDKSNVSFVINYNMPMSIEQYYQEAGRAGRDGSNADCILLYSKSDVQTARFLIQTRIDDADNLDENEKVSLKEKEEEKLKMMTFYSTTKRCLRYFILDYFGEKPKYRCNNCSNCNSVTVEDMCGLSYENTVIKRKKELNIDKNLFNILKELRRKIADLQGVPAYIVFSDSVLEEMSAVKPENLRDFSDINGVGEVKLQKYGQKFIDKIIEYNRSKI